jgi:hypothetical protein
VASAFQVLPVLKMASPRKLASLHWPEIAI